MTVSELPRGNHLTQLAQPVFPFAVFIENWLKPPYVMKTPSAQSLLSNLPPTPVRKHVTPPGLYASGSFRVPGSPATHCQFPWSSLTSMQRAAPQAEPD